MSVGLSDADPKSRPVTVAKLTTVVGMIPLLVDAPDHAVTDHDNPKARFSDSLRLE